MIFFTLAAILIFIHDVPGRIIAGQWWVMAFDLTAILFFILCLLRDWDGDANQPVQYEDERPRGRGYHGEKN